MLAISTYVIPYASAFLAVIVIFFLIRFFFLLKYNGRIKDYQSEIAKNHSRILKLELNIEKLQKEIAQLNQTNTAPSAQNNAMKVA